MNVTRPQNHSSIGRRIAVVCLVYLASAQPSFAYVDPGTGSMLLQMAIAGVAGALFYFRELRLQFTSWFRRTILGRPESEQVAAAPAKPSAQDIES